ncbi:RNA polymerase sigma factor [Paenibacillus radicis (ex Gao et al. 2016)]|uniref:RNA polymerase subunit sigma n=1 Tax=Paenibacillus radicis (ex Gao et al. 2016) TaxID=1737354 RepID=A0A917LUD9_9BACL|nr:RNA polymerase subunit sigma [Paenibacillus radicis (ex Gao et al. 2016)]
MRLETHYLQHLAAGYDRDAVLEELMQQYGGDLWRFAYFLTKRADAADDVVQEVFLAVYERMYAFRGESSVRGWLLAMTRNKSYSYLKTAFVRKVTLMDVMDVGSPSPSAENELLFREDARELWDAVLGLPLKFREVLILDYHYGLSIKEIASLLQLSEGTVKSRSHRAKGKLARLLKAPKGVDQI